MMIGNTAKAVLICSGSVERQSKCLLYISKELQSVKKGQQQCFQVKKNPTLEAQFR